MAEENKHERTSTRAFERKGAARLVRGAGCYVDDVQLPDAAYAAFVRSSAARAKITRLDLSSARGCSGVLAAVALADIIGDIRPLRGPEGPLADCLIYPLPQSDVHYVGEPLAVVVAESRYQAQDGADTVEIDYDLRPAILDPEAALDTHAPLVFDQLALIRQ
jgi:carbon-monoxide dehydrogenase large subunit